MQYAFILLGLFFQAPLALADKDIQDLGSCWSGPGEDGPRIASFREGVAYELDAAFTARLSSELEKRFGPSGRPMETYLHCGAYGHSLALRWVQGERHLCAWVAPQANHKLLWRFAGADFSTVHGPCEAVAPGRLIARGDLSKLAARLGEAAYAGVIREASAIRPGVVRLELTEEYHLREKEARERLAPLIEEGVLLGMDYDGFMLPIGEFLLLD